MEEAFDVPTIIMQLDAAVNYSLFDTKWIPCSAKFITVGSRPRGTGIIQIYEVSTGEMKCIKDIERANSIKCATFQASSLRDRHLATGDFKGKLNIYNLEDPSIPIYTANAHTDIINAIDGVAGQTIGHGAPEIVTGSKDGSVKVWDPRLKSRPVAVMEPKKGESRRDCWTVAFGNSYNTEERVVAAGYDNGDIKMFDLRAMKLQWEKNLNNGVCSLEFDRKDIPLNKLVATTLESRVWVFDLRTQHPKLGFSGLAVQVHDSTVWSVRHLPQNRDLFATTGGSGSIAFWKYLYPAKRKLQHTDGIDRGIVGDVTLLSMSNVTSQPVNSLDFNPDMLGLAVCISFDQHIRIFCTTKLNTF